MKFDKETTIALVICLSLIILWGYYVKITEDERLNRGKDKSEVLNSRAKDDKGEEFSKTGPQDSKQDENSKIAHKRLVENQSKEVDNSLQEEKIAVIENEFAKYTISTRYSSIKSVEFLKFKSADRKENLKFGNDSIPLEALKISTLSGKKDKSESLIIEQESTTDKIVLTKKLIVDGTELELKQSFDISHKSAYIVASDVQIHNPANKEVIIPDLTISGGSICDFKSIAGDEIHNEYISIDACVAASRAVKSRPHKGKEFKDREDTPIKWLALSNKYFSSILKGTTPFSEGNTTKAWIKRSDKHETKIVSAEAITKIKVPPGQTISIPLQLYLGPKERNRLKDFDTEAVKIMHLGWNWIEPLSQLLLTILVWMSKHIASYGWSIIILTFLVKLIFWPITEKANASMKKMQKIQPLILEVREKYKHDPQKMNAKIMQIYKEHGVNPFSGCFPILLQIPVFLALYNTLNGAVELRQASFLWANDLSRPDTIFVVPGIMLPINPLVIAMAVTMFIQQKLTPSVADQTQQTIMMMMPFIMLVMLYSLPSGLTLYWTVSQILSIIQLLINKYRDSKENVQTVKV